MAQQPIELILFRQMAHLLAVPVFLVDSHGDLVFLNEAAEHLLGIRFDDLEEHVRSRHGRRSSGPAIRTAAR